MADTKIVVDDAQLDRICERLLKPSSSFWTSDRCLRTAQLVALVAGGSWVLVHFILFERDAVAAARERDRALAQHSRLTMDIQTEQRALRQAELTHAIESQRLKLELARLEQRQVAHDLEQDTTYRFSRESSIKVERIDDDRRLYDVEYSITITNVSDTPFEISFWVLDYYIGTLAPPDDGWSMIRIGLPESRWSPGSMNPGGAKWQRMGTYSAIVDGAWKEIPTPWSDVVRDARPKVGGVLTGVLNPKQSYTFQESYIVRAPVDAFVGFSAQFCFERCKDPKVDLFSNSRYAQLLNQE